MTINEDSTNQSATTTDDVEAHRHNPIEMVTDEATNGTDDVEGHWRVFCVTDEATSDTDDDVEGHRRNPLEQ